MRVPLDDFATGIECGRIQRVRELAKTAADGRNNAAFAQLAPFYVSGAAAGALVRVKFRKPDPSMVCNGLLAGCVSISASCAFVNPAGAVLTGAVAGLLVVYAILFFEGTMKVDDPVGAHAL